MRAWIEPNDDPTTMLRIDVYDGEYLQRSISLIHRPLQWTIENLEPPGDYGE